MLSLIQPGPYGGKLDHYAMEFKRIAIPRALIFKEMIDCLKYRDVFSEEIDYFYTDIAYSDYLHHMLKQSGVCGQEAFAVTENLANITKHACFEMYRTLTRNGLYDKDGVFPYEYIDYQRGMFYLRGLR